jgi:hypothetical protein
LIVNTTSADGVGNYYTYDDSHEFLSSVPAGARIATSAALAGKSMTLGVFDADNATFSSVSSALTGDAIILFLDTGNEATDYLISYYDARTQVQVAVAAAGGATSITVEDLPFAVASGATLTLVSGSGPATITTSAGGSAGARSLAVASLSGALSVDAVYEYPIANSGFPISFNGSSIAFAWSDDAAKIFKIGA